MLILGLLTEVTFLRAMTGDFLSPIELPMGAVLLELMLILGLLLVVTSRAASTEDLLFSMELPMGAVLLELIRLLELTDTRFREVETDGCFVPIELPMRAVLLELMLILGLLLVVTSRAELTEDLLFSIELPMREVLLELIRLLEPTDVCFVVLEPTIAELLPLIELGDVVLTLELVRGSDIIRRLDVILPDELLLAIVLDGRLLVILLELRPDDILPGVDTLDLDVTVELMRLDGLDTLGLVTEEVAREGAVLRAGVLRALEEGMALGAAGALLAGWLSRLPELDLLLPEPALFAKAGSSNNIKAKISVTKAILIFPRYFSVTIICLLSSWKGPHFAKECEIGIQITISAEASAPPIKGANLRSGNKNSP